MNTKEFFDHLKQIVPDPGYAARSRRAVLFGERTQLAPWSLIVRAFQSGSALALAGVLILVIAGGFSSLDLLSPLKLSSFDPHALEAEAQAVDIQIHLTDIDYNQPANQQTTAQDGSPQTTAHEERVLKTKKLAENLGIDPPAPATSSPSAPTIDDVLDKLAE